MQKKVSPHELNKRYKNILLEQNTNLVILVSRNLFKQNLSMEAIQKPAIKQGWIRALLYLIIVSLIIYAFQMYGDTIINQFEAGTESGSESVLNVGILYALMG